MLFLCVLAPVRMPAHADEALVAVAANFAGVAEELEGEFESSGEHGITLSIGSTGKLLAQIVHGAPFDILLAADQRSPRALIERGLAAPNSLFTYARGRLALRDSEGGDARSRLIAGHFRTLAMANPELAPYGRAALETLDAMGLSRDVQGRIVRGENVAQAFAMVDSGAADLAFISASALSSRNNDAWIVPEELHRPIRQDAVLLVHGGRNRSARAFLDYLRSDQARRLIERHGYRVE